jgi:hypothetical protein
MVGVCLSAIGLIAILKALNGVEIIVDDLLAIGSLLFMVSTVLSFLGMRTKYFIVRRRLTKALDLVFCFGLVITVVATMLLTWAVL